MSINARTLLGSITIRCLLYLTLGIFCMSCFPSHVSATIPLISDDTRTQGKGGFQLEIPVEYAHDRDNGITGETTNLAAILTYGVTDPLDIALTVPYQFIRIDNSNAVTDEKGLSDLSIEAKWRLFEDRRLSIALKPGATLPTGSEDKGLGNGRATYFVIFITTMSSEREQHLRAEKPEEAHPPIPETSRREWAIHFNARYTRSENTAGAPEDLWFLSAAGELEILDDFKLLADLGIMTDTEKYTYTPPAYLLAGFIYSPRENFDIGLGVKAGLSGPDTDYAVRGGVTLRF